MAVRCAIHTLSDDSFKDLVARHVTRRDILRELGLRVGQGYYNRLLNNRVAVQGLDTSHWVGGNHPIGRFPSRRAVPLEVLCVEGSVAHRAGLKHRLLRAGLLQNVCTKCGQGPEWHGEPLSLQLDHINGDGSDNTLTNLRILCPNCHTQTPTFGTKRYKKTYACACGNPIRRHSARCQVCETSRRKGTSTKINWPEPEVLLSRLADGVSMVGLGTELGVSDVAVKKHLKKLGLWTPRRTPRTISVDPTKIPS